MNKLMERIAANLKKYRQAKIMSQAEVSRKSGVTLSLTCWLENCKRSNVSLKTLYKLAETLGVSVEELIADVKK